MLIFLLILCILLSGVELYIRNRISFIISKPRAKRISFFLELMSVVAVSIFTFADAQFYMKYSVYDSLFFKSILIFALSLFLGTCAFCGFIGFICNNHFLLETSQWISGFIIAFYSIYFLVLIVDYDGITDRFTQNWVVYRGLFKVSFFAYNDPIAFGEATKQYYWVVLLLQPMNIMLHVFLIRHCKDMHKILEERTIFSYFCVIDIDRNGVLGEKDLSVRPSLRIEP